MKRQLIKHRNAPGYSLVVLVVLVTSLVAVTIGAFTSQRGDEDARKAELTAIRHENLKQALIGPAASVSLNGQPVQSGFISDTGLLPFGSDLSMLAVPPQNMKPWSVLGSNLAQENDSFTDEILPQISIFDGWRGPYFVNALDSNEGATDGWGAPFVFSVEPSDEFVAGGLNVYSHGKDGKRDLSGEREGYEDDYPFSNTEKMISSLEYTVPAHELPQNLVIRVGTEIAEDELCNFYIGLLYPGMDLSQTLGGEKSDGCNGGPGGDSIPDGEFKPETGAQFDGSISKNFPTVNSDTVLDTKVLVSEMWSGDVNINQSASNTDSSEFIGEVHIPGEPRYHINGDSSRFDVNERFEGETGNKLADALMRFDGGVQIAKFVFNAQPEAPPEVRAAIPATGNTWQSDNDFDASTVVNANINNANSQISLPPGSYGDMNFSSGADLTLGQLDPDTLQPVGPMVYSFNSLTLNSGSDLKLIGPVELRIKNSANFQSFLGNPDHPEWLYIHFADDNAGQVNLNANSRLYGSLNAPNARVHVNTDVIVTGSLFVDNLTMNSGSKILNGYLEGTEFEPPTPPDGGGGPGDPPTAPELHVGPDADPVVVSLADLITAVSGNTRELKLQSKGEDGAEGPKLYFNKPLARRYQIAIFEKGRDNGKQIPDSLAGQLAYVYPKVYSFARGADSALISTDTQQTSSDPEYWVIGSPASSN